MGAELGGERRIDLGLYARAIVARWWLLPVGVLVGALLGFAVLHGRSQRYRATSEIYLGDTGPASDLPTNLTLISQYVTLEPAIRAAARKLHVAPGRIRGNVTTSLVLGPVSTKAGSVTASLLDITVTTPTARLSVGAANDLAHEATALLDRYPDQQLSLTRASVASDRRLATQTAAILSANQRLRQHLELEPPGSRSEVGLTRALSESIGTELKQQMLLREFTVSGRLQAVLDATLRARTTRDATAVPLGIPSASSGLLIGAIIGFVLAALTTIALPVEIRHRQS